MKFGYYMIYDSISGVSHEDTYRLLPDPVKVKKKMFEIGQNYCKNINGTAKIVAVVIQVITFYSDINYITFHKIPMILFSINMHKYYVTDNLSGKHPYFCACVSCSVLSLLLQVL